MTICPITQKNIIDYSRARSISYSVKILSKKVYFEFCENCFNKIDFKKYRSIIYGLILNNKFNPEEYKIHWQPDNLDDFDLKIFLDESYYPRTPKEKLDNLIIQLEKNQYNIGEQVFLADLNRDGFSARCYFDNQDEFMIYLMALRKNELIEFSTSKYNSEPIKITFEGYNYLADLEDNGSESTKCFIAMAFKPETENIRQAIKKAIIKTGFKPIIIDEQNIDSDQTINDAIIAGIKKSKFCISDFSYHRNGVYFESGFALGLGKPVIYCCSKEEFGKAHFDIKPLQHIIYESEGELEKRLIDKIEAWIK